MEKVGFFATLPLVFLCTLLNGSQKLEKPDFSGVYMMVFEIHYDGRPIEDLPLPKEYENDELNTLHKAAEAKAIQRNKEIFPDQSSEKKNSRPWQIFTNNYPGILLKNQKRKMQKRTPVMTKHHRTGKPVVVFVPPALVPMKHGATPFSQNDRKKIIENLTEGFFLKKIPKNFMDEIPANLINPATGRTFIDIRDQNLPGTPEREPVGPKKKRRKKKR